MATPGKTRRIPQGPGPFSMTEHPIPQHIPPAMQSSLVIDADEIKSKVIGLQIMPPDQSLGCTQRPIELVAIDARQRLST